MQHDIRQLTGDPPTRAEIDEALARARVLRSAVFRSLLRSGGRSLQRAVSMRPDAAASGSFAPSRAGGRPFWGMLPNAPRWLQARAGRPL